MRTSSEVHAFLILFLIFQFGDDRLFSLTAREVRAVLIFNFTESAVT